MQKIKSEFDNIKEFKLASWAINNRTSVYVIVFIILIWGMNAYNTLQKEKFPDIVIPTVITSVVYPGTSPSDIENLVTRPIEKRLKSISGVKKITSTSVQDYCIITAEFNTGIEVDVAKQKVKDAVDKAQSDLPNDLPQLPNVQEVSFSEMPILYVNLSGDYPLDKIKLYAEKLQDKIEGLKEITRVDIVGALEKEIKVDVDLYKLEAAKMSFNDVENAIRMENTTVSGGIVTIGDQRRTVSIKGQYVNPKLIGDILIKSGGGSPVYLRDIATVTEGFKDQESFARLDGKPVITLNIIKRTGENLIAASDKIRAFSEEMKRTTFPKDLKVTLTGDQSTQTRNTLNDLINTIIIGFILVTLILMFFMGTTNAFFVALSVPLSALLAFIVIQGFGYSLNMIILFAFLLALGIVVDDAIVVIENTHRIYHNTKLSVIKSAKLAAGEVFIPVLAGTLTTIAPFIPLLVWPGLIGKFMFYLPFTLIVTLFASLVVAFLINPVFAVTFMKKEHGEDNLPKGKVKKDRFWVYIGIMVFISLFGYLNKNVFFGNLMICLALFVILDKYVFIKAIKGFQEKTLPGFQNWYANLIIGALKGWRPFLILMSIIGLFGLSIVFTAIRKPGVVFFPGGDPNFIFVYIELPNGTHQNVTDSIAKIVEKRVEKVLGKGNPDIESIITNISIGAGDPQNPDRSVTPHKGKVSVAFKEFGERIGGKTGGYMQKIRDAVADIPVAKIRVDKESNGPPLSKPINIEISGEDYGQLITLSKKVKAFVNNSGIKGIEDLRSDLEDQNPEIRIDVDREMANTTGLTTGQIGMEIRTAIFGFEASKFKRDEDEYPIQVRYSEDVRKNVDAMKDIKITYRDMASGQIKQIPLSSVAKISYGNTLGSIKRKNLKRVITLGSSVLNGFNENAVVDQIKAKLKEYKTDEGFEIKMTGQQEDQAETSNFLGVALGVSIGLIFFILVTQFNSISKPVIILSEILFSIIGVLFGFSLFKMEISIVMTGVGILALAGIVVKNGILLIEFADELRARGMRTIPAIIEAGRTRLNPVILTATACILGLIPLAIGLNINFYELIAHGKPGIYIGGDSVTFWGPLSWTIIFGLSFATIITLIVVPCMYLMNHKLKVYLIRRNIIARKKTE